MSSVHSEELVLLSYLDGELDPARAVAVREHLDVCHQCSAYVSQASAVLRLHGDAVRASLPAPPQPWVDLRPYFNDLDAEQRQLRRARPLLQPVWWAAAAVAIALAVIALRLSTNDTVRAAELLAKASVQELRTPVASRIQVRTREGSFIRAAHERGKPELAAMFRHANFDWDRPLRAGAFADWRSGLANKRDQVQVLQMRAGRSGGFYRITTSTPEGGLRQVSVTIRAADWRAVEERFEFRNREWVEISEAPEQAAAEPVEHPSLRPSLAKPGSSPAVTLADEIGVFEALHRIGADLGEPIEVRRGESSVEVTVLGASGVREKEIRQTLAGLPNVVLRFEQPQAVRGGANGEEGEASTQAPSGPMHSRLLRLMGSATNVDAFTNSALESSEAILARAHALRLLAQRFPEPNSAVHAMAADHHRVLRESVNRLKATLHPLTGNVEAQQTPVAVEPRSILGAAQRLDTLLTLALASPNQQEDADQAVARMRRALAELEALSTGFTP